MVKTRSCSLMVTSPLILEGGPKNSDQNNWGGDLSKNLNLGGGDLQFQGGL